MRISTTNMNAKPINQKRGPTTGNQSLGNKRSEFLSAKSKSGSERGALADMVIAALETRGNNMKSHRDPATEPLKSRVNVGRGPTKGNRN
jgi:hypothetical protein